MEVEIKDLKNEVESYERTTIELQDQLKDVRQKMDDMQQELDSKDEDFKVMKIKHDLMAEELMEKDSSLEDFSMKIQEKDEELRTHQEMLHQQSDPVVESLQQSSNENREEKLQVELKKRELLVSDLVSDCMRLKNKLTDAESEIKSLKDEVASLSLQTQNLTVLRAQYEINENHLKSQLSEKDRVIHRQQEEVEEVRDEHHNFLQEFGTSQLSDIHNMLLAYLDDIRRLKGELMTKSDVIDSLNDELKTSKEENDQIRAINTEREAEILNLNEMALKKEDDLRQMQLICKSAEENCVVVQDELDSSRIRWEEEKTRFIMKLGDEESMVNQLKSQLNDNKNHVSSLYKQMQGFSDQIPVERRQAEELKSLLQQSNASLKEKSMMLQDIRSQMMSIQDVLLREDSVFYTILANPMVVHETPLQSSEDAPDTYSVIQKKIKSLEDFISEQLSGDAVNKLRIYEQQRTAADERIKSQSVQVLTSALLKLNY